MKKVFIFAALAGTVFASCQKEAPVAAVQNEGQQEIAISTLSKGFTRGVLNSGASFANSGRTLIVAGAMKSNGKVVDFLNPTDFKETAASSGTGTEWTADPKVYYPLGGKDEDFRFLAYSETKPNTGSGIKPIVARWYGSTEVEIQVTDKCDTNEIVYAGFKGKKDGVASATFKHSQALVTVYIKTAKDSLKINSICFEDVKTSGALNLKINPQADTAGVTANWLFNAGCNCKLAAMGNFKLKDASNITTESQTFNMTGENEFPFVKYVPGTDEKIGDTNEYRNCGLNTWINTTGCVFDRLFPAQEIETKTMVINYTIGDLTADASLVFENTTTPEPAVTNIYKWEAGKRYIYKIEVNPAEIKLNPTMPTDAWTVVNIAGEYK